MMRILTLMTVLLAIGCGAQPTPLPPREVDPTKASLKELQAGTAQSAVAAGANAGQKMLVATNAPVAVKAVEPVAEPSIFKTAVTIVRHDAAAESKSGPLIRITGIRSDKPQANRERALTDALQVAQTRIQEQLLQLDPPVQAKPTLATIRHDYLKNNSVREVLPTAEEKEKLKASGIDANRLWVSLDVELTDAQVQTLRSGDRVSDGLRGSGILFTLIAAVYGFLRLDLLTKGYFTAWLAVLAAILVALATGVLVGNM